MTLLVLALALPRIWSSDNMHNRLSCRSFSDAHAFEKPNDARGLGLMNAAARSVMVAYPDVALAFGESDEYRCAIDSSVVFMDSLSMLGCTLTHRLSALAPVAIAL